MKFDATFFTTPTGQLALLGLLAAGVVATVAWRRAHRQPVLSATAQAAVPIALPKVFTRDVARIPATPAPISSPSSSAAAAQRQPLRDTSPTTPTPPRVLPITVFATPTSAMKPTRRSAPFGRMISCETIGALESTRIATPVIGLVTEDVWHLGRLIIPAGAEVHGRASVERERERLAANGRWVIVWQDAGGARELRVEGMALDREFDRKTGAWGEHDGSAGLRGTVLRTDNLRETKLFAATFLSTATAALQDTRNVAGVLGEIALPAATARNGALAGTSAILREYAQQIRDSIARDGFYLRVPAGKPFYLYVTETLDADRAQTGRPEITLNEK